MRAERVGTARLLGVGGGGLGDSGLGGGGSGSGGGVGGSRLHGGVRASVALTCGRRERPRRAWPTTAISGRLSPISASRLFSRSVSPMLPRSERVPQRVPTTDDGAARQPSAQVRAQRAVQLRTCPAPPGCGPHRRLPARAAGLKRQGRARRLLRRRPWRARPACSPAPAAGSGRRGGPATGSPMRGCPPCWRSARREVASRPGSLLLQAPGTKKRKQR